MQGAQKLRSAAHLQVRRNDEVAAQRSRWTFYETINYACFEGGGSMSLGKPFSRLLRVFLVGMPFLLFSGVGTGSLAETVNGRVVSVQRDEIEMNIGTDEGLEIGDKGRVYYTIKIDGQEMPIFIGEFAVTKVSEKSARAQIQERKADIKVGYEVEVKVNLGALEVRSEPPGGVVYLDGKEVGRTPIVLPKVKLGRHQIRVLRDGYDPYEVWEVVGSEQKEVLAKLKIKVQLGAVMVLSDPPGAGVYLDDRLVGQTPYEGKDFNPKAYKMRVVKEGYEGWEREVDIQAGKRVEVYAQLKAKEIGLEVRSDPSGARVWVNGQETGTTPLVMAVRAGQYLVRVFKEGHAIYEEWVTVTGPDRKLVEVSLKRILGDLIVQTDPPEANVYLDEVFVGKSPYEGKGLLPKAYKVRVGKDGYGDWEKEVRVEGGRRIEVLSMLRERAKEVKVSPPQPQPPPQPPPKAVREPEGKAPEKKARLAEAPRYWKEAKSGMEFVLVEGGCFEMGDTFGEGENDEKPVHEVCVDDFYIAKYETSQDQFKQIMNYNPSSFPAAQSRAYRDYYGTGGNYPVEGVSWNDAEEFINKFRKGRDKSFRLPTEAEWEYAARGGGAKVKWAGTSSEQKVGDYAWFGKNSGGETKIIGKKEPNSLGLYDMSGNVWEWVEDWYEKDYYNKSPKNNPKGPSSGTSKVLRSGAWDSPVGNVRVADRHFSLPSKTDKSYGFRLVFSPP